MGSGCCNHFLPISYFMAKKINLVGHTYNRLTVISENFTRKKVSWDCVCVCGNTVVVQTSNLRTGHTKSCGCHCKEIQYNKAENLSGRRFGRLLVLDKTETRSSNNRIRWNCLCDCGNKTVAWALSLKSNKTQSCGCLQKERASKAKITHGHTKVDLPNRQTSEYATWCCMKYRCNNPNYNEYPIYGGRGIRVCDRWNDSFENFLHDMGLKPTPKHTLDRFPNQNGNYEPSNCRWATQRMQQGNRRDNVWHEKNGKRMILSDWARYMNLNPKNMTSYIKTHKGFDNMYNFFLNKGVFNEKTDF